jgi:ribose transport system permease protein
MTTTATRDQKSANSVVWFSRFRKWEASGVLVALLALVIVLSFATPAFLSQYNMSVVARQASFVGLIALGQTLVLLIGGIDLSVGAAAGLSAIFGSLLLTQTGVNPYAVLPITALFGMVLGCINGFFVACLRLNPFIVTLASWEVFAGVTLVITKGYPIRPLGEQFRIFGQGNILGIPIPVVIFLLAGAILSYMLARTRFGRNIYAVGGNRDAAELVGIRTWRIEFAVFGLAGMFAALAGILYASRMDSGSAICGRRLANGCDHGRHHWWHKSQRRAGQHHWHHPGSAAHGSPRQRDRADGSFRLLGTHHHRPSGSHRDFGRPSETPI